MRVMRTILLLVALLTVFGALATVGWASHHPNDPRVHAARDWPVLGPWVTRFQAYYLGPDEVDSDTSDDTAAANQQPVTATVTTQAPARTFDALPTVWVAPEMPLYRAPSPGAEVVLVFDRYANLSEIESRDGWTRVRFRRKTGWLAPRPDDGPILGRDPVPVGPLASVPARPAQLESARKQLGSGVRAASLGPYDFLTDSPNQLLIDRLEALASQLDAVFTRRFGLRPLGQPMETVILFEQVEDYRAFKNETARIADLNAAGHAERGLAALFRGDQDMDDVSAVFVHEITHLITRRAIGPALPLWLAEGIAEALSSGRLLPWGDIEPEAWGGSRRRVGNRITMTGEWSARQRLRDAIANGTAPHLERVIGIDDETFQNRSPQTGIHYTIAGTFVRFLLDGDGGRHRAAFQGYLQAVAAGGPATADALIEHLDSAWDALDRAYRSWITAEDSSDG